MNQFSKIAPLQLETPRLSTEWFEEPFLTFADGEIHSDPKIGIPLYGPRSLGTIRHKNEMHLGFIGTAEGIEQGQAFYEDCANGIDGDEDHAPFPGCGVDVGFCSKLRMSSNLFEPITRQERLQILSIRNSRERFEAMLGLLQSKMDMLTRRDSPLDYISVVLPKDLYDECRVTEYKQKGIGEIHRDLRRAFKAVSMQFKKPTQILHETTTTGISSREKKLDHKSRIAWNLFTGLYFKVDGLPWGPVGLPPASCFIGISFFRPLGSSSTLHTSIAQAFDENGEGLILRGRNFEWDEEKLGKSPHLTAEMAEELVTMVLEQYGQERKQLPRRVVIHKSSRYEPDEREGFDQALKSVPEYDLVALAPNSNVRLVRAGKYPPLRGTSFTVGDVSYLYTNGYLPSLAAYPHGHVPSPLQIADHVGDTSRKQLLREIMILTKMNWNSADMSGLMPITLKFSRLVGDILKEVDPNVIPEPKYKYYI